MSRFGTKALPFGADALLPCAYPQSLRRKGKETAPAHEGVNGPPVTARAATRKLPLARDPAMG